MNTVQIAIVKKNGKNKGLWRVWLDNADRWEDYWHGIEVDRAKKALKNGTVDMGGVLGMCRVKSYI